MPTREERIPDLLRVQSDESAEKLSLYIKTLYEAMEKSPGNVKLKDI